MADRKARSVTFKLQYLRTLGELKEAIDREIQSNVTVFQELGNAEILIDLANRQDADLLIEESFGVEETPVSCHPPHGQYTNVSILNLRSYIQDAEVKKVLSQYGEIKGDIIRLKYKADHAFAGMENGNRLVKMLLEKNLFRIHCVLVASSAGLFIITNNLFAVSAMGLAIRGNDVLK